MNIIGVAILFILALIYFISATAILYLDINLVNGKTAFWFLIIFGIVLYLIAILCIFMSFIIIEI